VHLQLTGTALAAEAAREERQEKLQLAMRGMKLLLVLDFAAVHHVVAIFAVPTHM
jgi:hypothetical protein